jgi:hypothetical protein
MAAPLIISFDILDDTKLLPAWPILTNREVIAVNQAPGAPGRLIRKWSVHAASDPLFAWADKCESKSAGTWAYDSATKQLSWTGDESGEQMCLAGQHDGAPLEVGSGADTASQVIPIELCELGICA